MQDTQGLEAEFVEEMDLKAERIRSALKEQCLSYDQLLENLVLVTLGYEEMGSMLSAFIEDQKEVEEFLRQISISEKGRIKELNTGLLEIRTSAKIMSMKALLAGVGLQKTTQAKKALSGRLDQQQKDGWIAHCRKAKASGATISNLDDLLSIAGYDPLALNITPRTLKTWAKEAGVGFKAGRPKK